MKQKNGRTKAQLVSQTHQRLEDHFRKHEISDVVSIFLKEFLAQLQSGEPVIIRNFAKFSLAKTKPRPFHNLTKNTTDLSKGNHLIKAKLSKNLKKLIIQHLDIEKTFLES